MPAERQTMLFSATLPNWVSKVAKRYQRNPTTIDLVGEEQTGKLNEDVTLNVMQVNRVLGLYVCFWGFVFVLLCDLVGEEQTGKLNEDVALNIMQVSWVLGFFEGLHVLLGFRVCAAVVGEEQTGKLNEDVALNSMQVSLWVLGCGDFDRVVVWRHKCSFTAAYQRFHVTRQQLCASAQAWLSQRRGRG
jgi:hypothetical protein